MPRRIGVLVFPQFQLLDAAGPLAAFEVAGRIRPGSYEIAVIAARAGSVASSVGVALAARALPRPGSLDTLIIAGGDGSYRALKDAATLRFLRACAQSARRVSSVCSGAFLLAAAGLLDGRPATTHWSVAERLRRDYPRVRLDADRIFVRSGALWTSAGISAGIDLSLALIAEDLGEAVARRTAQYLVVYHRRPGGQSQFSALLELERLPGPFAELLEQVRTELTQHWTVAALAARVCMSPRHFARSFRAALGITPAKAVERIRADAARALLESAPLSVKEVARRCGFAAPERLRRAFVRLFGAAPTALRRARPAALP